MLQYITTVETSGSKISNHWWRRHVALSDMTILIYVFVPNNVSNNVQEWNFSMYVLTKNPQTTHEMNNVQFWDPQLIDLVPLPWPLRDIRASKMHLEVTQCTYCVVCNIPAIFTVS